MFWRCNANTAAPAAAVKSTVAHGSPRTRQRSGSAAAVTSEAREA